MALKICVPCALLLLRCRDPKFDYPGAAVEERQGTRLKLPVQLPIQSELHVNLSPFIWPHKVGRVIELNLNLKVIYAIVPLNIKAFH